MFYREHVCRNHNQKKCDNTLGLAQLGTMCNVNSCAIVQDNGLSAAFTIAHELGHVYVCHNRFMVAVLVVHLIIFWLLKISSRLSMPHDDDNKCKDFEQQDGMHNVMSRMLDHNSHPWTWSACSRHFLTEYLEWVLTTIIIILTTDRYLGYYLIIINLQGGKR